MQVNVPAFFVLIVQIIRNHRPNCPNYPKDVFCVAYIIDMQYLCSGFLMGFAASLLRKKRGFWRGFNM